jgi:hypothetical protein
LGWEIWWRITSKRRELQIEREGDGKIKEASVCLFILFFKPSSSSKFFLFVLLNFLKLRV